MIQYIYFVKCPGCEDEHFDFFDEAKEFALSCLSQKPIITQTEVCRNDFGECTDHCDLGTVWSWEDMMKETEAEPTKFIFTRDDLKDYTPDCDPEFDSIDNSVDFEIDDIPDNFRKPVTEAYNFDDKFNIAGFSISVEDEFEDEGIKGYNLVYSRNGIDIVEVEVWEEDSPVTVNANLYAPNIMDSYYDSFDSFVADLVYKADKYLKESKRTPVPEGMTIKELVEEMEENEDEVECALCQELFAKSDCYYDEDEGYICPECKENTVKCTWCGRHFEPSECRKEVDLGWLCSRCEAAIKSRGETLTFKEGNYWDFLDEDIEKPSDEDLDWHTYKITFSTKANPDKEQTTTFKTWQSDVEYAWRKSNANIPHTVIKNIELIEDLQEEPTSKLEELEEAADYRKRLVLCPECGDEHSYDRETSCCLNCGFN